MLELKSVEKLNPVHKKQLLTYLKLTNMKLGYLLNFGAALMKDGISRIINGKIEDIPLRVPMSLDEEFSDKSSNRMFKL
jgi:hypothetical protein